MIIARQAYLNNILINVKISGSGKNTIIFIHGSSQNTDTWLPQLENQNLSNKYRLIAFDLPGHGNSGWLTKNPENYKPVNTTFLINPLLSKFDVNEFILVGLSYGTNVIGEIQEPIKNCKGIVLASACILNEKISATDILTPGPYGHVISATNPSNEDLRAFAFEHVHNKKLAEHFTETYRKTDPTFREQLAKALIEGDITDEPDNIKRWNIPVCVVFGKNETLIRNDYLNNYKPLWKNKIFLIEHAGHLVNEENSEAFNELLLLFADDVFK
jgi:pimeloyl-ACP methyl ester carboxylesterase